METSNFLSGYYSGKDILVDPNVTISDKGAISSYYSADTDGTFSLSDTGYDFNLNNGKEIYFPAGYYGGAINVSSGSGGKHITILTQCGTSGHCFAMTNDNGGMHEWFPGSSVGGTVAGSIETSMVTISRNASGVFTYTANRDGYFIYSTYHGNDDRDLDAYVISPLVAGQTNFPEGIKSYNLLIWTDAIELLP